MHESTASLATTVGPSVTRRNLVCVAKYGENTDWVAHVTALPVRTYVVIYDKATTYRNVGREAETFLRFLVDVYDDLDRFTHVTLLQGNPFDHVDMGTIVESLTSTVEEIVPLGRLHVSDDAGRPDHPGLPVQTNWEPLGLESLSSWTFVAGAQYTIPSRLIRRVPKSWWMALHREVFEERICPWTMERYWLEILRRFPSS